MGEFYKAKETLSVFPFGINNPALPSKFKGAESTRHVTKPITGVVSNPKEDDRQDSQNSDNIDKYISMFSPLDSSKKKGPVESLRSSESKKDSPTIGLSRLDSIGSGWL